MGEKPLLAIFREIDDEYFSIFRQIDGKTPIFTDLLKNSSN